MFSTLIKSLWRVFWAISKVPLILVGSVVLFFVGTCFGILLYRVIVKKEKLKKGSYRKYPKRSVFKKLFWDAPVRIIDDMLTRDPDFFRYQGLIIFTGRQGRGKSVAMTEFARRMKWEYPRSKCLSNLGYPFQDDELNHWKTLVDYSNGVYGVIAAIDETQLWFSQKDSSSFPGQMLGVITQNRKNRRIILGTAQSVHNLAKDIRVQASEIRECNTLLGCITIVHRKEPILNEDGDMVDFKNLGWYFFVHDADLRASYDTWKIAKSLKEVGFDPKPVEIPSYHKFFAKD